MATPSLLDAYSARDLGAHHGAVRGGRGRNIDTERERERDVDLGVGIDSAFHFFFFDLFSL